MSMPSKRRRTSPSTYVSTNGQNEEDAAPQTTPKRASYLSPTKASLARSNPSLLPKIVDAQNRRESSPNRRRSLRDAVLGDRSEHAEQSSVITNKEQLGNPRPQDKEKLRTAHAESTITSGGTRELEPSAKEDETHRNEFRSPLKTRQSSVYTPRQYRSIPVVKSQSIVPTLVHSSSKSSHSERRDQDAEGELPPTPVELGSDQQPHRPKGLASSSPGGDGRRRVRAQGSAVTSSPLKPRMPSPEPSKAPDYMEIASGVGDEEEQEQEEQQSLDNNNSKRARSDLASEAAERSDFLSEKEQHSSEDMETSNTHTQLKALQDQLQMLKAECDNLENFSTMITKSNTPSLDWTSRDASFELLLSSLHKTVDPLHPPLESHELFRNNPATFMTLFAPGNLVMSYQTWEKKVKGARKFVYETTFAAPKPWPLETFNLTFETTFDLESDMIENIRFKRVGNASVHEELEQWIDAQLENSVMQCDLATIVTGVGRYLEADIARARIFKQLNERFPSSDPVLVSGNSYQPTSEARTNPGNAVIADSEVHSLLPFLGKTQMTFSEASGQTRHKTRRSASSGSTKDVMVVYEISLNWIGNPSRTAKLVVSGFTEAASQNASKMFKEIEDVKGTVPAFESVWDVLGMARTVENGNGINASEANDAKGKGKGRSRKSTARRMTDFD